MEQPKNDVLKVKRLHVEFQTSHGMVHAVKDVSLEVKRGRIHALVGESGSGKTTLARILSGILIFCASHLDMKCVILTYSRHWIFPRFH